MPSFYEIQEEISAMLEVADSDLTPEQREAMDEYLDELGKLESDKVDGFCRFFRSAEARAAACREEAARLVAKAKGLESRLLSAKNMLLDSMQRRNLKKLSGEVYTLSTRKVSRVDASQAYLPALEEQGFAKVIPAEIKPDLLAIGKAIREGQDIPGCRLIEGVSLQVR